jgi:hypothetical protein
MSQRGRPRKNGVKPTEVLYRTMVALRGYEKARAAGEKYEVALEAAIAEVQMALKMRMSVTEVKRVLAEFRSETQESVFLVSECDKGLIVEGRMIKRAWGLSVGPKPTYPRHNARNDRPGARLE